MNERYKKYHELKPDFIVDDQSTTLKGPHFAIFIFESYGVPDPYEDNRIYYHQKYVLYHGYFTE